MSKDFEAGYNLGVKEAKGEIEKLRSQLEIAREALESFINPTWSLATTLETWQSERARKVLEKIKDDK